MSVRRIISAALGTPLRVEPEGHGDLWTTTWADNDELYCVADDARGFGDACRSNLLFNRIAGEPDSGLHGETLNCMAEYGSIAEVGPDGGHWKANGLTCIDGVLYLSVSRHFFLSQTQYHVQETSDSSIVKSEDHGATWTAAPPIGASMFPGPTFSTPYFVDMGKDGRHMDAYVYAVSANGVWNNGSSMTLGRVRREQIGGLDPSDWEFMHGADEDGNPIWRSRHDTARYVFRDPGRTSMTGIHHIPALDLYVLPQWHYPKLLEREHPERWQLCRWDFYQAPSPWGPWERFLSHEFEPEGFYNPTIPSKFIAEDGLRFRVFTAGDFATQAHYALHVVPVNLEVEE